MFAPRQYRRYALTEKARIKTMPFHVIHNTLTSRESRDALPCVHGMRLVLDGRFTAID